MLDKETELLHFALAERYIADAEQRIGDLRNRISLMKSRGFETTSADELWR